MKVRRNANSCCSHKKVAREKLVPPIKLPLPSESGSDMGCVPPGHHLFLSLRKAINAKNGISAKSLEPSELNLYIYIYIYIYINIYIYFFFPACLGKQY